MERITKLLTPNPYSRPQETDKHRFVEVRFINHHWYQNPKQSAMGVWKFFEDRKYGHSGYGGAKIIIDPDIIIQAIPNEEFTYDVTSSYYTPEALRRFSPIPAWYGISIEWAHEDWSGKPHRNTLYNAKVITAELMMKYNLNPHEDNYRHWDITYKCTTRGPCPRWFVERPEEWEKFKEGVKEYMVYLHERTGGTYGQHRTDY